MTCEESHIVNLKGWLLVLWGRLDRYRVPKWIVGRAQVRRLIDFWNGERIAHLGADALGIGLRPWRALPP
jgi:hypothetical protein